MQDSDVRFLFILKMRLPIRPFMKPSPHGKRTARPNLWLDFRVLPSLTALLQSTPQGYGMTIAYANIEDMAPDTQLHSFRS